MSLAKTYAEFSPTSANQTLSLDSSATTAGQQEGLAFDALGNLFVADTNQHLIREFSPAGADLGTFFTLATARPFGLVFDPSGNLFYSDLGNNQIREIASNGADLGILATNASEPFFIAITPSVSFAPEPGSAWLLGFGLAAIVLARSAIMPLGGFGSKLG